VQEARAAQRSAAGMSARVIFMENSVREGKTPGGRAQTITGPYLSRQHRRGTPPSRRHPGADGGTRVLRTRQNAIHS
jgi:hypothetical protein